MIASNLRTLKAILLLILVAMAASLSPIGEVVPLKYCEKSCLKGQMCIKDNVQCFAAPCPPFYTCAEAGGGMQLNPCAFTTCPVGYSCVPRKLKGHQIDFLPSATCVPNCWVEECSDEETCISKTGQGGIEEPVCISLSKCRPEIQNTCTGIDNPCGEESCKMIDCQPQCIPFSP